MKSEAGSTSRKEEMVIAQSRIVTLLRGAGSALRRFYFSIKRTQPTKDRRGCFTFLPIKEPTEKDLQRLIILKFLQERVKTSLRGFCFILKIKLSTEAYDYERLEGSTYYDKARSLVDDAARKRHLARLTYYLAEFWLDDDQGGDPRVLRDEGLVDELRKCGDIFHYDGGKSGIKSEEVWHLLYRILCHRFVFRDIHTLCSLSSLRGEDFLVRVALVLEGSASSQEELEHVSECRLPIELEPVGERGSVCEGMVEVTLGLKGEASHRERIRVPVQDPQQEVKAADFIVQRSMIDLKWIETEVIYVERDDFRILIVQIHIVIKQRERRIGRTGVPVFMRPQPPSPRPPKTSPPRSRPSRSPLRFQQDHRLAAVYYCECGKSRLASEWSRAGKIRHDRHWQCKTPAPDLNRDHITTRAYRSNRTPLGLRHASGPTYECHGVPEREDEDILILNPITRRDQDDVGSTVIYEYPAAIEGEERSLALVATRADRLKDRLISELKTRDEKGNMRNLVRAWQECVDTESIGRIEVMETFPKEPTPKLSRVFREQILSAGVVIASLMLLQDADLTAAVSRLAIWSLRRNFSYLLAATSERRRRSQELSITAKGRDESRLFIGIDLGTTYSSVAVPLELEGEGHKILGGVSVISGGPIEGCLVPSIVAIDTRGRLIVGEPARSQSGPNCAPILLAKKMIADEERYFNRGGQHLSPKDVIAEILRHLKGLARRAQGEMPISGAVITVPAHFSKRQRQKILEAGETAELGVVELVEDPVAITAMCYERTIRKPSTIMVCDLGGGTFEVTILNRAAGGDFHVKSKAWTYSLGGAGLDRRVASWIVRKLKDRGYRLDTDTESPELTMLQVMAEKARIALSKGRVYNLKKDTAFHDLQGEPVAIDIEIPPEVIATEVIADGVVELCHRALHRAQLDATAPEEILLTGGCSRMPRIEQQLKAAFGAPIRKLEPEAVVIGAAIKARQLAATVHRQLNS